MSIAEPERRFRKLGKYEQIPLMPDMMSLLESLQGAMVEKPVPGNARSVAYNERIERTIPVVQELRNGGMKGHTISKELNLPYSVVYNCLHKIKMREARA